MAHYGEAYQNLCNVQKALISLVISEREDLKGAASCAREIVAIEAYKRELRGQARLKAVDAINAIRHAQRTTQTAMPLEITSEPQVDKESLKHSQEPTVTAPPSQTPHHLDE